MIKLAADRCRNQSWVLESDPELFPHRKPSSRFLYGLPKLRSGQDTRNFISLGEKMRTALRRAGNSGERGGHG